MSHHPFQSHSVQTEVAIEGGKKKHPLALALQSCGDECVTLVLDILDLFAGKKEKSFLLSVWHSRPLYRKVLFDMQRCLKVYESALLHKKKNTKN